MLDEPLDEGHGSVPNRDGDATSSAFLTLRRLRPLLSQDHTTEEFEHALEGLLDRMDRMVSQ